MYSNMKKITFKGTPIYLYTVPKEYFVMVGVIPKDAIPADVFEIEHMTGFVTLSDKPIRLLIHPKCSFRDVLGLVSHERGHKVEGGFKKNPPDKFRYATRHEQKADHYQNFTLDSYDLAVKITLALKLKCI